MSRKLLFAAGFGFMAGVLASSCGGGPRNFCVDRNVNCTNALICDPTDGVCKCGGRGGLICRDGETCDATSNTCRSTKCAAVDCTDKPGTSCDVVDGQCKCGGTGGLSCGATEICNPNAKTCVPRVNCNEVACPKNQTCDNTTGKCKCAQTECAAGQFCSPSGGNGALTCIKDICSGVTCSGTTKCDPADGYCKCNAVICQSGESCACPAGGDGGCLDTARTCKPGSACAGVNCVNGTTCDPVDGQCKCGGPGGPVCASNQICALGPPAQCQGGQQCLNPDGGAKSCTGGTSCDPEDGKCKCGGRGGQVCAAMMDMTPAEVCVSNPSQKACRRPCDVRAPDCPTGTYCYYDPTAATPAAYCSPPTGMAAEETACLQATVCFAQGRALHCSGLAAGTTGICRAYCDVASGTAGCVQVPKPQTCNQIAGAPAGYGFCLPMN